jgi:hypothetical protein
VSRIVIATIAVLLLAGTAAGCGGDDDTSSAASSAAPADLGPADVRANLEDAGYVLGEDITDGANLALPPKGKIDADLYFSVNSDPEQQPMHAGLYFFSDPADAQTVSDAFSSSFHEVRDTRLYNLSEDDQAMFDALVATGEGE